MTDDVMPAVGESARPSAEPSRSPLLIVGGAALLIGLWWLLQLWGLGAHPFHTHGEAREALVVWQMTHDGGWILPRRDGPSGSEIPSKPPLFHWLAALTAVIHGDTDEWSIRLPSAALSLAGGLVTYATGVALWGAGAGLCAATITLTSFEWQRAATGARVDMALTFGLVVAFCSYLFFARRDGRPGWLLPFYGGMAFAVLAKGPVGVALPALLIGASCAVQRDVEPLRRLRLLRGLTAVTCIAGLWYLLAMWVGGFAFVGKQLLNENVFRLFDANDFEGGHRHGPFYLLWSLAAGFLPWTLLLPGAVTAWWRARAEWTSRDPRVYMLLWIVIVFALYSLAVSKRSVYLLALYPALGLLLGSWVADVVRSGATDVMPGWWRIVLRGLALTLAGLIGALIALTIFAALGMPLVEWVAARFGTEAGSYGTWIAAALRGQWLVSLGCLGVAAAAAWWLARALAARAWPPVVVALLLIQCAGAVLTSQVVMPAIAGHLTYRAFMPAVRAVIGTQTPLFFYRTFEYEAAFYWGGHIGVYGKDLSAAAPRYLLMTRREWEQLPAAPRDLYERVPLPAAVEEGDEQRLVLVRKRADG
ncbi:MAG: glycosyltransferase family 39 protein [Deltaproteobacteria bacterium]|nr:glycosyltransferase family 39 protein [Deltaproteobacteria bacterium]MBI3387493.1 glycosyltransferase family 39 protein [Deltaproteobacteria bacterium]